MRSGAITVGIRCVGGCGRVVEWGMVDLGIPVGYQRVAGDNPLRIGKSWTSWIYVWDSEVWRRYCGVGEQRECHRNPRSLVK